MTLRTPLRVIKSQTSAGVPSIVDSEGQVVVSFGNFRRRSLDWCWGAARQIAHSVNGSVYTQLVTENRELRAEVEKLKREVDEAERQSLDYYVSREELREEVERLKAKQVELPEASKVAESDLTVRVLHDSAMEATDEAHMAYRKAYNLERQAFEKVAALSLTPEEREPTFSILCSSAAWLAFNADLPRSAIEVAQRGLVEGKPDGYIRHGLEWVIEWSKRVIEERGK